MRNINDETRILTDECRGRDAARGQMYNGRSSMLQEVRIRQ